MARTCPACGRANDDDASFCQGCGSAIAGGTLEARRRAPTWLVVLLVAVVIAVIAAAGLLLFPRGEEQDAGDGSPATSTGATVGVSPSPALGGYLAGAVGSGGDRLAAIGEDGTVQPIADFGDQQILQIAYSPDGKWLACAAGTYERSELWLFDVATGDARQVTAGTPKVLAVESVVWLSATELLVAGYTEPPTSAGQNADLLVYDTAAQGFSPLLDAGGVSLRGVAVSASRRGAEVAFVSYTDVKTGRYGMVTGREHLEILHRASGQVTELGASKAFFDVNARAFDEPLISPSGEALIYRRAGSDVGTSYTVLGADGTVLMPAKEAQFPAGYAWDPDGTRVVFTGVPPKRSGRTTFWVFDTETGGRPVVLARHKGVFVQDLAWSPGGDTIAWAAYDEKKEQTGTIYLMPAGGGGSTALAEGALSPVWAPSAAPSLQTSPSP
jgi:hypothetical protein